MPQKSRRCVFCRKGSIPIPTRSELAATSHPNHPIPIPTPKYQKCRNHCGLLHACTVLGTQKIGLVSICHEAWTSPLCHDQDQLSTDFFHRDQLLWKRGKRKPGSSLGQGRVFSEMLRRNVGFCQVTFPISYNCWMFLKISSPVMCQNPSLQENVACRAVPWCGWRGVGRLAADELRSWPCS